MWLLEDDIIKSYSTIMKFSKKEKGTFETLFLTTLIYYLSNSSLWVSFYWIYTYIACAWWLVYGTYIVYYGMFENVFKHNILTS